MSILSKIKHWGDANRRQYLMRSLKNCCSPARLACPNCGSCESQDIARKMLVTKLRRCQTCKLLYRTPTDPPDFGEAFYQEDYDQGFTTDCPTMEVLQTYLRNGFANTPKDFSDKLALLQLLGVPSSARILDFGASWGYGTWQFQRAGYTVIGFEPGRSRARYARENLDVAVVDDLQQVTGNFDVIFSSHVMEHVPFPSQVIENSKGLLKPGGLFIAFTPNGSDSYRAANAASYHRHWGMVHPNYLDEYFYENAFAGWQTLMSKTPVSEKDIRSWQGAGHQRLALDGWELLAIARKPIA